jgi:dihydrodiol dehydrogenase / D-xylose 1-dehydrogenase (NADP)
LVADANVEVIYVGTLHPQHAEHTILALEAGKHVLCEKPFAITREEGQRMVDAARKTGRFLMEAMWTRFQPSIAKVRELIAEGVIGKPKIVEATFGFKMPPPAENPRLWLNKLAGGCMMDLSVYPLALANMIFGNGGKTPPTKIVATGELSEGEAIDIQESITLQYGPGQMAVLSASMLCTPANEAFIVGDKGVIHIQAGKSAWHASQRIAYKLTESNEWTTLDFTEPARADQKPFVYGNSQMMRHEAQEVMECIRTGKTESAVHCLDESLVILGIMDEARKQLGVVFEQDRK